LSNKTKEKEIIINGKKLNEYFKYIVWQKTVLAPLEVLGLQNQYSVSVKVSGGGPVGQSEAIRHGLARALVTLDESYRKPLRANGFLTRDPRVKERKKPGLKRARRAPQWQKR
jgi:small subunit ribosomal protein S9